MCERDEVTRIYVKIWKSDSEPRARRLFDCMCRGLLIGGVAVQLYGDECDGEWMDTGKG